jgi:hypothetical protein
MTNRRSFMLGASVVLTRAAFPAAMAAFAANNALAAAKRKPAFFSREEIDTLEALVDVILPATDSPAASAANTHWFIDAAVFECATQPEQKALRAGVQALKDLRYPTLPAAEQIKLLKERAAVDIELPYDKSFFKILKDYTLTGYFLSEIGATQALAYERVPGGYQGDLPLAPNQKAWAI